MMNKQMKDWRKETDSLLREAIGRMDRDKRGATFEDAYAELNRSSDLMPDLEFMFEAGQRAMRLKYARNIRNQVAVAIKEAVRGVLEKGDD